MKTPENWGFEPDSSFTFGLAGILGRYFDRKVLDLVVKKKGEDFVNKLVSSYRARLSEVENDPNTQERLKAELVLTLDHFAKE